MKYVQKFNGAIKCDGGLDLIGYTDFNQIKSSYSQNTAITTLVRDMRDNSALTDGVEVGGYQQSSIYPEKYGIVQILKIDNKYSQVTFTPTGNQSYDLGEYRQYVGSVVLGSSPEKDRFTGWKLSYTGNRLSLGSDGTEAGAGHIVVGYYKFASLDVPIMNRGATLLLNVHSKNRVNYRVKNSFITIDFWTKGETGTSGLAVNYIGNNPSALDSFYYRITPKIIVDNSEYPEGAFHSIELFYYQDDNYKSIEVDVMANTARNPNQNPPFTIHQPVVWGNIAKDEYFETPDADIAKDIEENIAEYYENGSYITGKLSDDGVFDKQACTIMRSDLDEYAKTADFGDMALENKATFGRGVIKQTLQGVGFSDPVQLTPPEGRSITDIFSMTIYDETESTVLTCTPIQGDGSTLSCLFIGIYEGSAENLSIFVADVASNGELDFLSSPSENAQLEIYYK
ncbi:MAG TPA: hypothetical protein VFD25_05295 [Clostridia bacterium]|nr:hypothetical protein [Clostridia bacterium]